MKNSPERSPSSALSRRTSTAGPTSALAAAADLDVGFAGSLVGTTAYTSVEGEDIRGVLHRINGSEEQLAGGGVTLTGGTQGIRYEVSDFSLSGDGATSGFLAEVSYTPSPAQGELATVFAAGGNLFVRIQNGNLIYGFDSLVDGSWKQNCGSADTPTADQTHALSLQYLTNADRTELHVMLDGVPLPTLTSAAPSNIHADATTSFGFGNDVHPAAGDRGLAADLLRVRIASGVTSYDPSAFLLQPTPVATSLLRRGFGAPDGDAYAAASGEVRTDLDDIEPGNYVTVSKADCPEKVLKKTALVRPTDQQLDWQELGLTAFVHYGLNTYYDQEWGHGTEDPARFDPTGKVDVDTWMKTLRDSGHRMAILTVKHHDGFLLYPSRYTDYDVESSPWKNGEGDLVREFTDAAAKYGMKVGLYLSPADSHEEIAGTFGNGSPKSTRTIPTLVEGDDRAGQDLPTFEYEATDYGGQFLNTLYEVLTQYGEINEVWFDGANGNTEKREIFDYPAFYDLIGQLQPNAVVAVGGRDVRWVGNERGTARQDEWAPVAIGDKGDGGKIDLIGGDFEGVGSAEQIIGAAASGANALHWWPTESDMKLTEGWFAHPNDVPKSGAELLGHYRDTVGRNSVMLLNTPPTVDGSFAEASTAALLDFAAERRRAYADDVALGVSAETAGGASALLTDGNTRTAWQSASAESESITLDLGATKAVSSVKLGEGVAIAGQTVEKFSVQAEVDGEWQTVASAGTIGVSRIVTFDEPVTAQKFRVTVDQARAPYALATVSLYSTLDADPGRLSEVWVDCSAAVAGNGTEERPFSSLDQFRDAELAPGAAVHLRSGVECADSTTPFWGYGTEDAPITVDLYDGDTVPMFGARTAAEVFGGLEAQGWVLNLPGTEPSGAAIEPGHEGSGAEAHPR